MFGLSWAQNRFPLKRVKKVPLSCHPLFLVKECWQLPHREFGKYHFCPGLGLCPLTVVLSEACASLFFCSCEAQRGSKLAERGWWLVRWWLVLWRDQPPFQHHLFWTALVPAWVQSSERLLLKLLKTFFWLLPVQIQPWRIETVPFSSCSWDTTDLKSWANKLALKLVS